MSYCKIPFERIEIVPDGNVFNCCPSWLHEPIGNIFEEQNFEKIWNSAAARKIRSTMINNTYERCNHDYCLYLLRGVFKPVKKEEGEYNNDGGADPQKTVLDRGPTIMALNYDPTCNLHCKSCRGRVITLSKEKTEFLMKFQKKLLETSLFQNVRELIVTGNGDAFASKVCMSLLQSIDEKRFPNLKITLRTNGVLFTPGNWEKIRSAHYAINLVKISVDAATKATYGEVRQGGDFDRLLTNLSFISGLKVNKDLKLEAVFLMQKENYKEMPMFVELMKKYNFDTVSFTKINNWGTYTDEEFREVAIHRKEHTLYKAFRDILKHPMLKDPIVSTDMPGVQ